MVKLLLKEMRPKQWTKNVFVFAALVFDRQLFIPASLVRTIAAFVIFCLLSSSVYVMNDIFDVHSDRLHPTKKNRPIASGSLPISIAIGFSIGLTLIALALAFWISLPLAVISLVYLLVNLLYSKWLKHIVLVDVLVIAFGFVLRVAAGVSVIQVQRFRPGLLRLHESPGTLFGIWQTAL